MILSGTTRLGVAAAAAVLFLTGTTAGPAQAAAPAVGSDLSSSGAMAPVQLPGDKTVRTYTAADIRSFERTGGDPAVLAYWTAERMAAAKPLDVPGDAVWVANTARAVAAKTPAVATAPVAAKHVTGMAAAAPPPVTNWSITNGKLFFNGYESGSWCSASAVNTPSGRVLITAGHCVHSGQGGTWKSNVVFVPKYNAFNSDHDPVGRFQAYWLRSFNEWINNSNRNRDVGWVTTYAGGDWNDTVVNTVGGHGMAYNGGTEFDVSVFGYPSNKDNGDRMWACWGTAVDSSSSDDRSKISCDFGPGSSGGPWLWNYDNNSGLGYVRSVMSTVDTAGVNRGPYFDTAVNDGTNAANNDW
ncbi:trypsin-like serine peptidase [Catenuloplanes sp. NPDC051500]|uniref:trypsin-like serine peptidase n=1 Tax=Catenuloplanes sp. NPDC051500 TaxID=3363959 RepID=UPI003792DCA2